MAGFQIDVLYDNRINTNRSKIYAITHIGKFDVEICSEVIKEHYYLLSGDYENMKGTVEEIFLGLNGVVYVREDDKIDRSLCKEKMINILQQGGNLMYYPEGEWNLSPNLPVLPCPWGVIDVAMRANAIIIPIGIEQYGNRFVIAIGGQFDVSNYIDKAVAIDDLRSVLAGLKWDIWSSVPPDKRSEVTLEDFVQNNQKLLEQWPGMSIELFEKNVFKPKGIVSEKEVFSCLDKIEFNSKNAFLAKIRHEQMRRKIE